MSSAANELFDFHERHLESRILSLCINTVKFYIRREMVGSLLPFSGSQLRHVQSRSVASQKTLGFGSFLKFCRSWRRFFHKKVPHNEKGAVRAPHWKGMFSCVFLAFTRCFHCVISTMELCVCLRRTWTTSFDEIIRWTWYLRLFHRQFFCRKWRLFGRLNARMELNHREVTGCCSSVTSQSQNARGKREYFLIAKKKRGFIIKTDFLFEKTVRGKIKRGLAYK